MEEEKAKQQIPESEPAENVEQAKLSELRALRKSVKRFGIVLLVMLAPVFYLAVYFLIYHFQGHF